MIRVLVLIMCLLGNAAFAGDLGARWSFPLTKRQVLGLVFLASFTFDAYAQTNNTDIAGNSSNTGTILCTPYFVYWATMIGNVCGGIDATGWTIDWLASWLYYWKKDIPLVRGLKEKIISEQQAESDSYQQQLIAAANICDIIVGQLQNKESNITKEQILHCLTLSDQCLREEAQAEDHVVVCLKQKR